MERGVKITSHYGYVQKGNRYFWKMGATTKFNQGFKSKKDCEDWINEKKDQYGFDWRFGFMVKFKKFDYLFVLVDRYGKEVKMF